MTTIITRTTMPHSPRAEPCRRDSTSSAFSEKLAIHGTYATPMTRNSSA